jgi:hypothetical protein
MVNSKEQTDNGDRREKTVNERKAGRGKERK